MTIPTRVTAESLQDLHACTDQVDLFRSTFPRGTRVTRAALVKAAGAGLDLGWWAVNALPAPLLAEYKRQQAPLWAEYKRQQAPLWAEYERQQASLWAEYDRQQAPLLAEYERQRALVLADILDPKGGGQ